MTTRTAEISPLTMARIAGLPYLLVVPPGIFGSLYVEAGDARGKLVITVEDSGKS